MDIWLRFDAIHQGVRSARPPPPPYVRRSGIWLAGVVIERCCKPIPLTDLARALPLGQLTPYRRRVRTYAGRASNRSLTSPPHHSGNGTSHNYAQGLGIVA
jgi:hypothetical protein